MPTNPYEPPQRSEILPNDQFPFTLNWKRVGIGLAVFALLSVVYAICWCLGLATVEPGF